MSELTLTVLQLGFLVLLWLFILGVVGVLRGDLYGTRVAVRQPANSRKARRRGPPDIAPPPPVVGAVGNRPAPGARPPAARPPATPRQLVVTEGSLRGTTITLGTAPIVIGRAPESTLVIDDEYASSRHARLVRQGDRWVVEDLGSTNGTFVRRERLTAPVPIDVRVPIRIGRTVLELRA